MPEVKEVEFIKMHLGQTAIEVHPDAVESHMKAGWKFGAPDLVIPAGSDRTQEAQVVNLVAMEKGGQVLDVNPVAVKAHEKQGWSVMDRAPDQAGKMPIKELVRLATEWHNAWATERATEGWNELEIAAGRKAAILDHQLVSVTKGKETLQVNESTLEAHIRAGWTPKAHAVDMRSEAGMVVPIRINSIEHLLDQGWTIAETTKVITPAVETPLVPMWKGSERIEVHVSTMLQHAARGWSVEELEQVIKDGQVKEIPCKIEDAYLAEGWQLLEGEKTSKPKEKPSSPESKVTAPASKRSKSG
jgi:hypothetical protein